MKFPNLWETKIEETHVKKKYSHAQDSIYMIWQFAYVYGVAGFSLLSGKNYKVWQYSISVSQKRQQQTLITKTKFSKPKKISH